jgi:hypothetical protein
VLLRSCAAWSQDELHVVKKIIAAMGISVSDRRLWLSQLRHELLLADAHQAKVYHDQIWANNSDSTSRRSKGGNISEDTKSNAPYTSDNNPGISPSLFLKCLRSCGVNLNVEDEAILLDCLDLERMAEVGALKNNRLGLSTLMASSPSGLLNDNNDLLQKVPLIHYKSFLTFCARFCGHWTMMSPDIADLLKEAILSIANPTDAIFELASLFQSFDESSCGKIAERAFQISAKRSKIFSNFSEIELQDLKLNIEEIFT